jgi:hypothetical protein
MWKMKVSSNHIKAIISGIPFCFAHDVTALLVWLYDTFNEYVIKGQRLQKPTGMRHVKWTKETKEENCNQRASSKITDLHVTKNRSETYRVLKVSGQIVCYLNDRLYVNNNFVCVDFSSL